MDDERQMLVRHPAGAVLESTSVRRNLEHAGGELR
jgi:hypothetical protein